MRSIYLSHIGMTEPLGQSQVLPYLLGVARRGLDLEIVSFEPAGTGVAAIGALRERLAADRVRWRPLVRSPSHAVGRKIWESARALGEGLAAAARRRPDVVHARSYLPAAAADLIATAAPGAKLLFDCRGMLGDEYLDSGNWRPGDLKYRILKRFEHRLFARTEGLVVLTEALHRWLRGEGLLGPRTHVAVVPCCVDVDRFRVDAEARARARRHLDLGDRLVVVYSGTLGSWYLEREMARFVAALRRHRPDAALLVLTRAPTAVLRAEARAAGVPDEAIYERAVPPAEMPAALAAGDVGLSLIMPTFSKLGSSPTKVAEYLATGLVAVVNAGVGDQADLAADRDACVVLPDVSDPAIEAGAARALALAERPWAERAAAARAAAQARFSLAEIGVPRYEALYRTLCS